MIDAIYTQAYHSIINMIVFLLLLLPLHVFWLVFLPWLKQYELSCRLPRKARKKVFGIGMPRTGTSSLTGALERCGYKAWHAPPMSSDDHLHPWVSKFDALTDLWTTCGIDFEELASTYPDAKFILTIREPQPWLKSIVKYRRFAQFAQWIPGYSQMHRIVDQLTLDRFERYNGEVQAYFAEHAPERLLVMNIADGDGWETLCPFLGCSARKESFPREREMWYHVKQCWKYPLP